MADAALQNAGVPAGALPSPLMKPEMKPVAPMAGTLIKARPVEAAPMLAVQREIVADAGLLQDVKALWARMLEAATESRRLRVLLADLTPESVTNEELVLVPHPSVLLAANTLRAELQSLVLRVTGRRVVITYRTPEATGSAEVEHASAAPTIEAMSEHPLVKQAMELTGGKVIGVQARKK